MSDALRRRFLDTYLSIPIIKNERDRLFPLMVAWHADPKKRARGKVERELKALAGLSAGYPIQLLNPDSYPALGTRLTVMDNSNEVRAAITVAERVMEVADAGLTEWGMQMKRPLRSRLPADTNPEMERQYNLMRFYESYLNLVARSRAAGGRGNVSINTPGAELHGNEYVCVLIDKPHADAYFCSYAQILMLKDMYYGRFNTLISAHTIYGDPTVSSVLHQCYDWAFSCISAYGNAGYGLVKSIERLAKTSIIRKVDPHFRLDGPYQQMLRICRDKEVELSGKDSPCIDHLDGVLTATRSIEIDVELFGLQKLSGHPLVDPTEGGVKVRETSRQRITYRPVNIRRVRNEWCRMYLEGYIRKERAWPPLEYSLEGESTRLYSLMIRNELKITTFSYDFMDWDHFRFKAHHEFNYFTNFTDLMDDKSISLYRDNFMATWDSNIQPTSNKRLLLEMLQKPLVNIKAIVDQVREGNIPFEWLIVSLYPKEREFKDPPRMYGMLVFEMRAFFACTEANLADTILQYLPSQTMTLNKIEIQELFQEVTKGHDQEGFTKLYGEFDLAGWNGHFHDEIVDPVARDIEDIFGLKGVYTVIHHFFKDSIMSVRVRECPPTNGHVASEPGHFPRELEDGVLWPDHDAGIEGQAQKLWFIATCAMFGLAMNRFDLKYYTIGQGDNHIYIANVPDKLRAETTGGLKGVAHSLALAAEEECSRAGHELNVNECTHSSEVITYSKALWIGGVDYFTSIKATSRVFPHSSSDFPSIVNSTGAISGQLLSAAEQMKDPLNGFALTCFHTALYLGTLYERKPVETSLLTGKFKDLLSPNMIIALMIYPGEMGGLPIGHVMGFLYKGGSDPLGKAVASLKLMTRKSVIARRISYTLASGSWMDSDPDLTQLIDDPYSLPIIGPRTPEMAILRQSISKVKAVTKNDDIRSLMELVIDGYDDKFRKILATCRPLNPVLLADIYGWSVLGVTRTTLKMFTSTQTIQSLLQKDQEMNPCLKILSVGATQAVSLASKLSRMSATELEIGSAYDYTRSLRRFWFPKSEENLVGVTTYDPVDFKISYEEPQSVLNGFKLHLTDCEHGNLNYHRGRSKVYFGRPTREKRSEWGYRIITTSGPERAVEKMSRVLVQPGVGPRLKRFIASAATTRGNIDLMAEEERLGRIMGGMTEHRFQSSLGHLSANLLGVTTFGSNCVISTDTAAPFSGGGEDYPIMIQVPMVLLPTIAAVSYPLPNGSTSVTLIVPEKHYEVIQSSVFDIDEHSPLEAPVLVGNQMAYAPQVFLQRSLSRHDLPLIGLLPAKQLDSVLPFAGLMTTIYRGLSRSHAASAVADRGTGVLHLNLDLAEISGVGVRNLMKAVMICISRIAIDSLFSRSRDEWRWTPLPVMMSLGRALASSLAAYIRHPMIQSDPWVQRHLVFSGLSYGEMRVRLDEKITRIIVDGCLTMFNDPTSSLYTQPICLFFDELDGASWSTIAHVIRRTCLRHVLSGELELQQAYALIRKNLTVAIMGKTTELDRIVRMSHYTVNVANWAERHALYGLRDDLMALHRGRAVVLFQTSAGEALRVARRLQPVSLQTVDPVLIAPDLAMIRRYKIDKDSIRSTSAPLSAPEWKIRPATRDWDHFSACRLRGRQYGGDSAAGYSFYPLVPSLEGREFLMVGAGHGGGPAVLLACGSTHCYGLDLISDLDPHNLMNQAPIPSSIQYMHLSDRFTRIVPTYGWDGNVASPLAIPSLKQWLGRSLDWVIDIPLTSVDTLRGLMRTMKECIPNGSYHIRVLGSQGKIRDLGGFLLSESAELHWVPVYVEECGIEGWFSGQLLAGERQAGAPLADLYLGNSFDFTSVDMSFLGGGKEEILSSCTTGLSSRSEGELWTACRQLESMVGASVGELEHRFTYSQWTRVLESLICIKIYYLPDGWDLLLSILDYESVSFDVVETRVTKAVDRSLLRLLTRMLARAL